MSLLFQCKIANSTLLSLLSFSYFITPYDAQASSAVSALILYIIKCQSINYDSVKFQVNRLRNEKVTKQLSASSNKQEGATLLILFNLEGSDEIGYFTWKFQLHALMM